MTSRQLIVFLTILCIKLYGQTVKEMTPELGDSVDKSADGEIQFIKDQEKCVEIWRKVNDQSDIEKLSIDEKKILENCSETIESYWDIITSGCSWYCGGGQDTNSASSFLRPFKGFDYSPKNIHDLSYKTAWVEGVPGYGIGEYVTYHFPPDNPRITKIIVVNGYVRSDKTWRENSRVKKLKMYINDKPYAILRLEDTKKEQSFKFDPIGRFVTPANNAVDNRPWWTMKFEILDVYKGDKYDDTAITEIYFDGIDVH